MQRHSTPPFFRIGPWVNFRYFRPSIPKNGAWVLFCHLLVQRATMLRIKLFSQFTFAEKVAAPSSKYMGCAMPLRPTPTRIRSHAHGHTHTHAHNCQEVRFGRIRAACHECGTTRAPASLVFIYLTVIDESTTNRVVPKGSVQWTKRSTYMCCSRTSTYMHCSGTYFCRVTSDISC